MSLFNTSYFNDMYNYFHIYSFQSGYAEVGKEWKQSGVCNPFNHLFLTMGGCGTITCEGCTQEMQPGHAYLLPAGHLFDCDCENHYEFYYHHFNLLLPDGKDLFEGVNECLRIELDLSLISKMKSMTKTANVRNVLTYSQLMDRITLKFVELAEEKGYSMEFPIYPPEIMEVISYIYSHLSAKLTVSEVAEHLHLTAGALSKQFQGCLHVTMIHFIHQNLMQQARRLLILRDCPIKEISDMLQFRDQYYFSRFFSKREGVSPRQYRSANAIRLPSITE